MIAACVIIGFSYRRYKNLKVATTGCIVNYTRHR